MLLVEDDRYVAGKLTAVSGRLPLDVATARGGHQALDAARGAPFDLLLMDVKLPDISGLDVVRTLHTDNIYVPFIVVGGHMTVSVAVEAMELGAVTVLEKPFDVDRLLLILARALWPTSLDDVVESSAQDSPEAGSHLEIVTDVTRGRERRRSIVDRVADYIVDVVTCPHDPKTIEDWARHVNTSSGNLRGYCRAAHLHAHAARDVGRALRALFASGRTWLPEIHFDFADLRTLRRFTERAGVPRRNGGPTPTIGEFLDNQRWIPQDHPVLLALRMRLRRSA